MPICVFCGRKAVHFCFHVIACFQFQRLLANDEEKNKAVVEEIKFLVSLQSHNFLKPTVLQKNSGLQGYPIILGFCSKAYIVGSG